MKKTPLGKTFLGIIALLAALLSAACTGPKQLAYLQDLQGEESLPAPAVSPYRLQAGDQLTVRVSSFDRSAVSPFNVQNGALTDIPYIIDDAGNISLPGLGVVPAAGTTVSELTERLQDDLSQMAKGAVVRVELVSAFVSVLGEVNAPTRIRLCPPGLTLAEALTDAGDLRPNASRIVVVLRRTADGTCTFRLDLTKKETLSSPAWQLQPGDIIYVAPRRGRRLY